MTDLRCGTRPGRLAQRELLSGASLESLENTPFRPAEQAGDVVQLNAIKNYIKENCELTREQFVRVEASIDEAEVASHRLGRKDWLLLFLGRTVALYITRRGARNGCATYNGAGAARSWPLVWYWRSPPPLAG